MNTRDRKMSLFNEDRLGNLLPKDGTVNYYGEILASKEANKYFDLLMQIFYGKMMKSSFLVSILLLKEKLHGMVILTTYIPIQIQQSKH
jgi:hypothetical protein